MPDDLCRTDILAWSRLQAGRLRRHLAGERVKDLDWEHVIEEIEGFGTSESARVESLLTQAMIHAVKRVRRPQGPSVQPWQAEAVTLLEQSQDRYRASMAKDISVGRRFERARKAVLAMAHDGDPQPIPERTALTLDALMDGDADLRALVDALGRGPA